MSKHPGNYRDMTGQRFGRLSVGDAVFDPTKRKEVRWKCLCDCGNETVVNGSRLRSGRTKSCGCLKLDLLTKHGKEGSPEYKAWEAMRARCATDRVEVHTNYGQRGITVCAEWETSFAAFFDHIGPRPSAHHSLDRIDNDGNYEPGNVRWATKKEQNRNKRNNRIVTAFGKQMTLAEAAERAGLRYAAVTSRFYRGWPIEQALGLEPRQ